MQAHKRRRRSVGNWRKKKHQEDHVAALEELRKVIEAQARERIESAMAGMQQETNSSQAPASKPDSQAQDPTKSFKLYTLKDKLDPSMLSGEEEVSKAAAESKAYQEIIAGETSPKSARNSNTPRTC
jgi:Na+-transporting NADH:ubiquinone oxidoreductase subunit NqrC